MVIVPTTGRLEHNHICAKVPALVMRLFGGSATHAEQPLQIPIDDVLHHEGVLEFFSQEEVSRIKKKFVQGPAVEAVSMDVLQELRKYITHRRDKLSRALIAGREMSESAEDTAPNPQLARSSSVNSKRATEIALNGKKREKAFDDNVMSSRLNGKGAKRPLKNLEISSNESPWPTAKARSESKTRKTAEAKATTKTKGDARREEAQKPGDGERSEHDFLYYNPSLREFDKEQVADTRNDTYLGWSQARLVGRPNAVWSETGRCELIASGEQVSIISSAGVDVGMLREPGRTCVWKFLRRHVAALSIEASVSKAGTLEMLFYGPQSSLLPLQAVLLEHDMPYKPPTDEQPITAGVKVDRVKEEQQLAGYMSGGGSMQDLLEDQSIHEDMAELMGPPSVRTSLLQHQRKALHWMVEREKPGKPLFWEPHVNHYSGQKGWINTVTRTFTLKPPKLALGGMLADEMGLGKTLTVISLVMRGLEAARAANARQEADHDETGETNKYGSTLIVCPLSVLYTWAEQLALHTDGSATVLLYHGKTRPRHSFSLLDNEIVLTTYSVLASEYVPHNQDADGASLSPLHSVRWERVVLDEAHVIANRQTLQSRAVIALHASARWVVTGTPIQNKIDDVYPMLAFLRVHPLEDYHWFTRYVFFLAHKVR